MWAQDGGAPGCAIHRVVCRFYTRSISKHRLFRYRLLLRDHDVCHRQTFLASASGESSPILNPMRSNAATSVGLITVPLRRYRHPVPTTSKRRRELVDFHHRWMSGPRLWFRSVSAALMFWSSTDVGDLDREGFDVISNKAKANETNVQRRH